MNFKNSLLFYLDICIIKFKRTLIIPLQELEFYFNYDVIYNNRINKRYWDLMKLYRDVLLW